LASPLRDAAGGVEDYPFIAAVLGTAPEPESPAPRPAKQDPLFEAVVLACYRRSYEDIQFGDRERKSVNTALKGLRQQGATPEQVAERAAEAAITWGDSRKVTPHALDTHWAEFGAWVEDSKSGARVQQVGRPGGLSAMKARGDASIEEARRRFAAMEAAEGNGHGQPSMDGRTVVDARSTG
jgi:hypothetical protein